MGFDRHMFLMDIEKFDLTGLTSFLQVDVDVDIF